MKIGIHGLAPAHHASSTGDGAVPVVIVHCDCVPPATSACSAVVSAVASAPDHAAAMLVSSSSASPSSASHAARYGSALLVSWVAAAKSLAVLLAPAIATAPTS